MCRLNSARPLEAPVLDFRPSPHFPVMWLPDFINRKLASGEGRKKLMQDCVCSIFTNPSQRVGELSALVSLNSTRIRELAQIYLSLITNLWHICPCANPFFFPVIITVLCKSIESEVRRISSFFSLQSSPKFRTNTRELSLNDTKLRGDLCEISCLPNRNFGWTKFHRRENSRLRKFGKTKFRW